MLGCRHKPENALIIALKDRPWSQKSKWILFEKLGPGVSQVSPQSPGRGFRVQPAPAVPSICRLSKHERKFGKVHTYVLHNCACTPMYTCIRLWYTHVCVCTWHDTHICQLSKHGRRYEQLSTAFLENKARAAIIFNIQCQVARC